MKLFAFDHRWPRQFSMLLGIAALCVSCATQRERYGSDLSRPESDTVATISPKHTFYLVGDAGNSDREEAKYGLLFLKEKLGRASANSTLLFLGDNIYPAGMPAENAKDRALAEEKLNNQIVLAENFKGKTIFIPGNHDWYNNGLAGLKRQADFVTAKLGKKSFLPAKGCGIDDIKIGDDIALILIDSQWLLEDWDNHPTINDDCSIKSRAAFYTELEDVINKSQGKTTIIAMHHPLFSNGPHGGQFSAKKMLYPLKGGVPMPVIGSVINFLRETSGLSPQDLQNKKYNEMTARIRNLVRGRENVIVVSGHEHNLQYIETDGIRQVISGAGSKSEAARAIGPKDFSFGGNGYAVIDVYETGETNLAFWGIKDGGDEMLHAYQIFGRKKKFENVYPESFPATQSASVYEQTNLGKSGFYNFLWGKHYRDLYGRNVEVKTVSLDTMYGGLKPVLAGGGHQSLSLRLEDKAGHPYVMRGLKKSAIRFLETAEPFKAKSIDFNDTYIEDFVLDFYTTVNPYTPFAIGDMAGKLGINHTNPKLFYVPKQNALGDFNKDYGDALYMIEERPAKGFEDLPSFGKPNAIISTDDVLANLHKDEKYKVDEKAHIRARLFDMLIGDWDRHQDQWRWAEHNLGDSIVYRPIPRDHDQAFCKHDGVLLKLILKMPTLRHMQSFETDIKNVKWLNRAAYPLDLALLRHNSKADWIAEAEYIKANLTDTDIDAAFKNLPPEMQDGNIDDIKRKLRSRREKIVSYASEYYEVLRKTVVIVGTDKKDRFQIERIADGHTQVKISRLKKDGEQFISSQIYKRDETNEIWIYGLDDDDVFEVSGNAPRPIRVRLIGGLNHDTYKSAKARKVKIYDFKSKENTFDATGARKILTDNYELNGYDYTKPTYSAVSGYPNFGYNPDDGVKIGAMVFYSVGGFERRPFSQKHKLTGNYYFATNGYEIEYSALFPSARSDWAFGVDAKMTSPNFAYNFFGYGNETENHDDEFGMDYNRVKTQILSAAPSVSWAGEQGGFFVAQGVFESVEIDRTPSRFIGSGVVGENVFETQNFAELNAKFGYKNYDDNANPTLGLQFTIGGGYKVNVDDSDRQLPYLFSSLGFSHRLLKTEKLVLATLLDVKLLLSDDFEFYQMAAIGGDNGLRGFRNQRFSGKESFYQTSDLRYEFGQLKNGILPLSYGLFGGFDYGRVWIEGENSTKWHTSYGGGLWFNGLESFTAKVSYFGSSDGGRFAIGFGFAF